MQPEKVVRVLTKCIGVKLVVPSLMHHCSCKGDKKNPSCVLCCSQFHMDSGFLLLLQTRWSLLFLPAVYLAHGPVSVIPAKMQDPGLQALQSHADQTCIMPVMFSPGCCVRVRHLAGQLDKQRWPLICYDGMYAQPTAYILPRAV